MSFIMCVSFPNFIAALLFVGFLVFIILYLWNYYNRSFISGVDKKFVLVTGCDSGFGRETALTLDKLGFGVFATCLTKKGEESLKAVTSSRVFPLLLDVTDSQRIKAVYARVKQLLPPDCGWLIRDYPSYFHYPRKQFIKFIRESGMGSWQICFHRRSRCLTVPTPPPWNKFSPGGGFGLT